jgi:hypothetical protein
MAHRFGRHICVVCDKPIALQTVMTDGDGHPIHAQCYLEKIDGKTAPKPPQDEPPLPSN